MKKSMRLIALGLAVIPCALMLTACGGGKDDLVDIKGTYDPVASTEYSQIIEDIDEGFDLKEMANGFQTSISLKAETNLYNFAKVKFNIDNQTFAKANSNENVLSVTDIEAYSKMNVNTAITMEGETFKAEASSKQYIKDGKTYINLSDAKEVLELAGYTSIPTKVYTEFSDDLHPVEIPQYTFSDLLEMIPTGNWGEELQISKSESETGFKIKVTATKDVVNNLINQLELDDFSIVFDKDIEFYIIYENNAFAGLYLDASASVSINIPYSSPYYEIFGESIMIDVDLNLQASGFDGQIKYPSDLSNYQLLDF